MANKNIFNSVNSKTSFPVVNTVNKAGGAAYDLGSEGALAQYVVTGCLNQTYYADASEQTDKILELAGKCSTQFVAQAAVYGHRVAKMKDTPALLANVLANRGAEGLQYLEVIFPKVISSTKMLRNFVQILRSGKCGRKSFGTATKRMINNWLAKQESEALFKGSIGNEPSLADVVKMVHPKAESKEKEAFYGWLLGKEYSSYHLSPLICQFEAFKRGNDVGVPEVDFRMLHNCNLDSSHWKAIAQSAGWNNLRMNLNNFQKHGCFEDSKLLKELANKLRDEKEVRKNNAFPYQLLTSYQATLGKIPMELSLALQDALEIATTNVPVLEGNTAVCIDTSGSMSSPVTGNRGLGATTTTTCVDVAGLVAASLARVNPGITIVPFDTSVHHVVINPRDSVVTNAKKLALNGGGTDCASALRHLNSVNWKGDTVIFVSDNESWYNPPGKIDYYHRKTNMAAEWEKLKVRNKNAKLVCIDIQPGSTTQVPDRKDVINIGGFSDGVFEVVANFVNGDNRDFVKVVKDKVSL